jgi:hypothetical protein
MNDEPKQLADRLAKSVARIVLSTLPPSIVREVMTVTSNDGSTLSLNRGSSAYPQTISKIPMLTSCSGAKSGDRVIVDTCGHVSYAVGILA